MIYLINRIESQMLGLNMSLAHGTNPFGACKALSISSAKFISSIIHGKDEGCLVHKMLPTAEGKKSTS